MQLQHITLVVQDWGGTLGLTLPIDGDFRSKLDRLIVTNTLLCAGKDIGPHFYEWRAFVRSTPDLPVGAVIRQITPQLSDEEVAAYDAPFPDSSYNAGVRSFPELAMLKPDSDGSVEVEAALKFWKNEWAGKSFMAIGAMASDVDSMKVLQKQIKGCPEPLIVSDAHHFLPEWGDNLVEAALRAFSI